MAMAFLWCLRATCLPTLHGLAEASVGPESAHTNSNLTNVQQDVEPFTTLAVLAVIGAAQGLIAYQVELHAAHGLRAGENVTPTEFCAALIGGAVKGVYYAIAFKELGVQLPLSLLAVSIRSGLDAILVPNLSPIFEPLCSNVASTIFNSPQLLFDIRALYLQFLPKLSELETAIQSVEGRLRQEIERNLPPGTIRGNVSVVGVEIAGQEFLHKTKFSPGEVAILAIAALLEHSEDILAQVDILTSAGPFRVINQTLLANSLIPGPNLILIPLVVPMEGPASLNGGVTGIVTLRSLNSGETRQLGLRSGLQINGFGGVGAAPFIVSSLELQQLPPYTVGQTLTGKFRIANVGNLSISLNVLTIGGRLGGVCPIEGCPDFLPKQSLILTPGTNFEYAGNITLLRPGSYHFFVAYQTLDGQWNTGIPTAVGVANTLDIDVAALNQPPTISSLTANPNSVAPAGTSTISVSASDSEGDLLAYAWSAICGTLSITSGPGPVTWTAPGSPTTCTVTVSVTDNKPGHSPVTQSVNIAVQATSPASPLAPPALQTPLNGATNVSTTPTFTWSAVSGANSGYRILVATSSGALPSDPTASVCGGCIINTTTPAGVTSFTPASPLNASTTYFWEVHGRSTSTVGAWSIVFNFTTAAASPSPPAAPSSLAATAVSSSQISLSWNDNSANETGFKIERKTGTGGAFTQIATTGAGVTTAADVGLAASTQHCYRVRASNGGGDSAYSNESCATTQATSSPTTPPQVTLGPTTLNFGNVQIGSCVTGPFAVQHIVGTGPASGTVSASPNPPFSIVSGTTFSVSGSDGPLVTVRFCPTSAQFFSGSAVVSSPGTTFTNTNTVTLTGTGTNPSPSPTTGAIRVLATLNGVGSWDGLVNYTITGPISISGNSVQALYTNIPAGTYAVTYSSGGPAGGPPSSITPSATQTLGAGQEITFIMNFITPIAAPLNLTATAVSSSQINARWQDNTPYETEFRVERKVGAGGSWIQIGQRPAVPDAGAIVEFSDTALSPNTTYFYRVRACNNNTEVCSGYSSEASATTPTIDSDPSSPSNLVATVVSSSQIDLGWQDNSTYETEFRIERKVGAGGIWTQIGHSASFDNGVGSFLGFRDFTVSPNTTYFYRVRACNNNTEFCSGYSSEVSATTM